MLRATVPSGPPPAILPLSEVRPGMVGQALTVFQGTKPEPFKIRVVSVLRNFLPKEDVILIRAEDPRVEFSGIVAGMSGSPVYIDGKLVGAVAYAWSFAKEPLGGVTPIETMLAERARPRRSNEEVLAGGAAPSGGSVPVHHASADAPRADEAPRVDIAKTFAEGLGLPPEGPNAAPGQPRLVRASVPLAISGFTPRTVAELSDELRPAGVIPLQAGGGRKLGPPAPGHVEPGSAIGVELVRGDMSMVATGTVTYVDGSNVLAFGHPLFGIGEVYLPLVDAEIHAFLPSLAQSFKMSSPLNEVGTLVQDRQSCIIGNLDARTSMLPIDVRVTGPGVEPRLFFSPEGVSAHALASSRGLRAMGELLFNPFEPAVLDRMDVDVRVEYRRDVAEIVGVSLPGQDVHAGDTVPLKVTLRPYGAPEYVETVPVIIPRTVAGEVVKVDVSTGALVHPDVPQAESLKGYIDNMRKSYSASSIVVTLQTPDDGASLRGRLIQGLPDSALDTLRPANQTRRADAYHIADRTVFPSRQLVSGKQDLSIAVKDDVLGTR